ncbi:MAG: hypothetical protein JRJ37_08740 [Deltaproteobacteria bacterium]|nr:hypothetical protein [Deltaproteobacteria bacterium]MBW2368708.1 hypothetical protein [Deltaproteobacteria bacterium]
MELLNIQYWVAFQLVLDLFLLILIVLFIRTFKFGLRKTAAQEASRNVITLMEPLLKEAQRTANAFDEQLKEKNELVRSVNEQLDSKIISLNLLMNRAEANLPPSGTQGQSNPNHVYDQQAAILAMYRDNYDSDAIAQRLSLPRGEVDLVIDLKQKFQTHAIDHHR